MLRAVILPTAELLIIFRRRFPDFPFLRDAPKDLLEAVVEKRMVGRQISDDASMRWLYRTGRFAGLKLPREAPGVFYLLEEWASRNTDFSMDQFFSYCGEVDFFLNVMDKEFQDMLVFLFGRQSVRIPYQQPVWIGDNLYLHCETTE